MSHTSSARYRVGGLRLCGSTKTDKIESNPTGRRERPANPVTVAQDSPFLNLPAELRNRVYELAAQNEIVVSVRSRTSRRQERTLYCPCLSLVCRQIRNEYKGIYLGRAPNYAARIEVRLSNFINEDIPWSILKILDIYPRAQGTIILRILLTNTWDPNDVRRVSTGCAWPHQRETVVAACQSAAGIRPHEFTIEFDPKTFDVEFCRQAVAKLDWCLGRYVAQNRSASEYDAWPKLKEAFRKAFERYDAKTGGLQQKRKSQKQSENGPKSKRLRV